MGNKQVTTTRRERLASAMSENPVARAAGAPPAAVFFSWPRSLRNGDVEHGYRADSDVVYLSGLEEPDAALVILPGRDAGESVLFLRKKDPAMEVWEGRRCGVEAARETFGVDEVHAIDDFDKLLPGLLRGRGALFARWGRASDARLHSGLQTAAHRARRSGVFPRVLVDAGVALDPLRLIKDPAEIDALERAAAASIAGHEHAMGLSRAGVNERTLEAALRFEFAKGGAARVGYDPIVAGGDNALVLHYVENDAAIDDGALILIDAGAEVEHYTADITRTYPVSGAFTPEQRDLYDIVLASQRESIGAARPGASLRQLDEIARRVLAQGLIDLGWLEGSVDSAVAKVPPEDAPAGTLGKAPLDRYYMHGTGHWLGSDVHDVGDYHDGETPLGFAPGMVFTVEPGLYVARDDDKAPAAFQGIGIRIEDNILITGDGHRNLTEALPTDPDEMCALVGTRS